MGFHSCFEIVNIFNRVSGIIVGGIDTVNLIIAFVFFIFYTERVFSVYVNWIFCAELNKIKIETIICPVMKFRIFFIE